MKPFEFSVGGADKNKSDEARERLGGLLLDIEVPKQGLHPMIESDQGTAERLAADALKRAAQNGEALYVSSEEVERMLHDPKLATGVRIPEERSVVMSPDLFNPNQYAAGVPVATKEIGATPMSQEGLNSLRVGSDVLDQALGNPEGFELSPVEKKILAEKYHTSRMGSGGEVKNQISITPKSAVGLDEFRAPLSDADRKKAVDDDWRRAQEIVRMQQSGEGLVTFRGKPESYSLEHDRLARQRAVETGRHPEGLAAFQTGPRRERLGELGLYSKRELLLRQQGLDIIYQLRRDIASFQARHQEVIALELDMAQLEKELSVERDEKKILASKKVLRDFQSEHTQLISHRRDLFPLREQLARAEAVFQKTFGKIPDEGDGG